MLHKPLFSLIAFSSVAAGQVQLQFPSLPGANYTCTLQLPDGDVLLVGSRQVAKSISSTAQSLQIALAPIGMAQYNTALFNPPTLGGSGNDIPQAASLDASGNIWIVGNTDSDDFMLLNPIVAHKVAYRTAGFVIELDPTGKLLFSTYLAGQQPLPILQPATHAAAIAFDSASNAYVGGSTDESDFPTTPGAYLSGKGSTAAFLDSFFYSYVVKISPAGKLLYGTELGTGSDDCTGGSACIGHQSTSANVTGLFVDATGAAIVAGQLGGGLNPGGGYVARLAPDASKLLWYTTVTISYGAVSTFYPVAVTSLYMAPDLSPNPQGGQPLYTGNVDLFGTYDPIVREIGLANPPTLGTPGLFAAQLKGDGSGFNYSVDLGISADARAAGIVTVPSGNTYLAGTSSSSQLTPPAGVPNLGSDFLLALDSSGSPLRPSLHLPHGVITAPPALGLTTSNGPNLLLLGSQSSVLTLPASYAFDSPAIVAFANSASFALNTGLYPGALVTLFGFDLPASSENVQVLVNGTAAGSLIAAPVLYVGPTQINLQVPFETFPRPFPQLQVVSPSGTISVQLPPAQAIGIFTTDGTHAAALNQDGTTNSATNPAPAGSIVSLFGTGAIWPAGTQDGATSTSAVLLSQELNRFQVLDQNRAPLTILYAGAAPGIIDGVFQINVELLPDTPQPTKLTLQSGTSLGTLSSNTVQVYVQ